ncbi:MAG TPA: NUDIX domain-containing protein [Rhizomicrobium sp.]|jgi:8-oxo-dGTP pyrophosphatase MutT (NUDIX family)
MTNLPAAFDKDEVIVRNRLRPKDAATLVLVRRDADGARVLMGQRHGGMAFMANKFVFPGGRVDPGDHRIAIGGALKPHVEARLGKGARGFALAAVRETFEEAGVLVGEHAAALPRTRNAAWAKFFAHSIAPRLDALEFIARAITPPNRTRRFDARFFMADASAIAHTLDAAHTDELLTPHWLTLAEARALDLPSITRIVLDEVEARLDGEDSGRPVPFYRFRRGKSEVSHL